MSLAAPALQNDVFERLNGGCLWDDRQVLVTNLTRQVAGEDWDGPRLEARVLNTEQPNAYVLAGGVVYVTVGLLDRICTEDELAAVIAHELGHLEDGGGFNVAGLTMTDRLWVEVEADRRAVWRLIDLGYDPATLMVMVERLADEQPPGWAGQRRQLISELIGPLPEAEALDLKVTGLKIDG